MENPEDKMSEQAYVEKELSQLFEETFDLENELYSYVGCE